MITYAKLFTTIYQGTLRGNSHGLLVFTNLLAHADKDGAVDIHPRAIAEEVGLTREQVQAAIDELEAPDIESRSHEEGGRRLVRMDEHRAWGWRVVNYVKYRAIRSEDDRREQNRISQANWRAKLADRKQSKPPSAGVSRDKPPSAHTEAELDVEVNTSTSTPKTPRKREPPCPDGVTEGTWADWLTLRKAKRAPVTETVVREAGAEAQKAGMSLEAFLRVWCARGSQGLQADWLKPSERGKPETLSKWIKGTSLDPDFQGYPEDDGEIYGNVPALR